MAPLAVRRTYMRLILQVDLRLLTCIDDVYTDKCTQYAVILLQAPAGCSHTFQKVGRFWDKESCTTPTVQNCSPTLMYPASPLSSQTGIWLTLALRHYYWCKSQHVNNFNQLLWGAGLENDGVKIDGYKMDRSMCKNTVDLW